MTMTKLWTFVTVALAVTHAVTGQVSVMESFEVSQYMGTWYEYAKYPTYYEAGGICISAEYSQGRDGSIAVNNTLVNGSTGKTEEILGTASVVSSGKLSVELSVSPSQTVTGNYWVLDTDYCTYSVVYSCGQSVARQSSTSVWILTRQRVPSSETVQVATSVLTKNNLSLEPLTLTDQSRCN